MASTGPAGLLIAGSATEAIVRRSIDPCTAGSAAAGLVGGTKLTHAALAGKPMMSNEEFDILKQELLWEGSKVAVLTKAEQVSREGPCIV